MVLTQALKPALRVWICMIAVTGLAGCELLQPRTTGTPPSTPEPPVKSVEQEPAEVVPVQTGKAAPAKNRLHEHLKFIDRLNKSDTRELNNIHARTKAEFEQQPASDKRLRLAWVWATPGHAHSNLWAARKQLQESLNDEQLPPQLARLVRVRLKDIERNLDMANQLSEADAKIRALTTLEHSMEERDAEVQEDRP